MQKEEKIIGMLEQIMSKQDEHSQKFDEHSEILDKHSEKLDEHSKKMSEHGQILTALRSGQEHLKAEIDGMKVPNAREFGSLKEQISDVEGKAEILRDDIWKNKTDIYRIKNTMGMK